MTIRNTGLSGSATAVAHLDLQNSIITGTGAATVNLNGSNNIWLGGGAATFNNNGKGNTVEELPQGGNLDGIPASYRYSPSPSKGSYRLANRVTPDFIRDGNPATPYNYDDLFFWPQDFYTSAFTATGSNFSAFYNTDPASASGASWNFGSNYSVGLFQQFYSTTAGKAIVGTNVPATKATIYISAKCPQGTSSFAFTAKVANRSNVSGVGTQSFPCTTSYATYSFPADYTSSSGSNLIFQGGTNPFQVAWIGVRPYMADFNGFQPAPLSSPAFSGNPTAPTPAERDNSTRIATTAFVQSAIRELSDGSHRGDSIADRVPPPSVPPARDNNGRLAAKQVTENIDPPARFPVVVAAVPRTTYSGSSGVVLTTIYTTPSSGAGFYRLCSDHLVTAAAGTGTSYGVAAYVSSGHRFSGLRTTANTNLAMQWTDSAAAGSSGCPTFWADANSAIQFGITETGVSGTPTILYSATLERLQ
jgi:hypothetical protein